MNKSFLPALTLILLLVVASHAHAGWDAYDYPKLLGDHAVMDAQVLDSGDMLVLFAVNATLAVVDPDSLEITDYIQTPREFQFLRASSLNNITGVCSGYPSSEIMYVSRFDGAAWSEVSCFLPESIEAEDILHAAVSDAGHLLLATADALLLYSGDQLAASLPTATPVVGVHVFADGRACAVTSGGMLHVFDGSAWSSAATGSTGATIDALFLAPDAIVVAGAGGEVRRYDGAVWSPLPSVDQGDVVKLAGSSVNELWALCRTGEYDWRVARFDGATWTGGESVFVDDAVARLCGRAGRAHTFFERGMYFDSHVDFRNEWLLARNIRNDIFYSQDGKLYLAYRDMLCELHGGAWGYADVREASPWLNIPEDLSFDHVYVHDGCMYGAVGLSYFDASSFLSRYTTSIYASCGGPTEVRRRQLRFPSGSTVDTSEIMDIKGTSTGDAYYLLHERHSYSVMGTSSSSRKSRVVKLLTGATPFSRSCAESNFDGGCDGFSYHSDFWIIENGDLFALTDGALEANATRFGAFPATGHTAILGSTEEKLFTTGDNGELLAYDGQAFSTIAKPSETYDGPITACESGALAGLQDGVFHVRANGVWSSLPVPFAGVEAYGCGSPASAYFLTSETIHVYTSNAAAVTLSGSVFLEEFPVCALILANGQYQFSCDPYGEFHLENVPPDDTGKITVFAFAQGFEPYRVEIDAVFDATAFTLDIPMRIDQGSDEMVVAHEVTAANPDGTYELSGNITSQAGEALCAMALANGQYMFSCEGEGAFHLSHVPLEADGSVTLMCFCSGLAPYSTTFYPAARMIAGP